MNAIKKTTLTGLGLLFFIFSLSSCKKDLAPAPEKLGNTTDLNVSADFDWKTSREITLNVVGLKSVNPLITNTLFVNSAAGVNYFKDLLAMNKDYTIKFAVPSTETNLVLNYGTKTLTLPITSGNLTFDYITE